MTISTLDFLHALYGDDGPQGDPYLLLIDEGPKPSPKVRWPDTVSDMASAAENESGKRHVYFGVCPATRKLLNNQKPKAKEHIASVPALWMDIDVGKEGAPETRDHALAAVERFPLRPTILVDSGTGYHAYWVFKEPLIIDTPVANEEAGNISKAWQKFFATQAGYKFDTTGNLDRVLRLPGSLNIKPHSGQMCSAVYIDGPTYTRDDFEQYVEVEEVDAARVNASASRDGSLYSIMRGEVFVDDIEIPKFPGLKITGMGRYVPYEHISPGSFQEFDSLKEDYREFRKMIDCPRNSDGRPTTPFDLSRSFLTAVRLYVNKCVNLGQDVSRQICFDLNTFIRHKNWSKPEDLSKAEMRPGCTEAVIRQVAAVTRPLKEMVNAGGEPADGQQSGGQECWSEPAPEGEGEGEGKKGKGKATKRERRSTIDDPGDVAAARAELEKMCGAKIGNVLRLVGTTPQEYSIEVFLGGSDEPRIVYVTVEQIATWKKFHVAWMSATGKPIPGVMTGGEWDSRGVPRLLCLAVDDHGTLEETTEIGQIKLAMIAYLHSHTVKDGIKDAYPTSQPFRARHNGKPGIWFFSTPLSNFVSQALRGDNMPPRKVCSIISRNRICEDRQWPFTKDDGTMLKPRVFRFPDDVVRRAGARSESMFGIKQTDYLKEEGEAPCFTESPPTQ